MTETTALTTPDVLLITGGSKQPPTAEVKARMWELLEENDYKLSAVCKTMHISKSTLANWRRLDSDVDQIAVRAIELREFWEMETYRDEMDCIARTGLNSDGRPATQPQTNALFFQMKHHAARQGDREYKDNAQATFTTFAVSLSDLQAVQEAYWRHQQQQG